MQRLWKKKDMLIRRRIWVCEGIGADYVRDALDFSGVQQVAMIIKTVSRDAEILTTEHWYGLTSANRSKLSPQRFLDSVRGHWSVENSLHHVKDRSWLEDKIYSKETAPGLVLGTLRNLSLNILRGFEEGGQNIKSMPKRALRLLMNPLAALILLARA